MFAFSFYTKTKNKYLIIIRGDANLSEDAVLHTLEKHFKKVKVRAVNQRENSCEMTCEVANSGELNLTFVKELKESEHVLSANWLLESAETIG